MRRSLMTKASRTLMCAAVALLTGNALAQARTLRIGLRTDPDILDPAFARTQAGRIVFAGMCDKLFDTDPKMQLVPQLATSYKWLDAKTLLIHIRPNVVFQDGEKLDAEAVKFNLDRYRTIPGSVRRSEIGLIDHIDVLNSRTLQIVLKSSSGAFLQQLTDRSAIILAPKAVEEEGENFAQHPVCAGPFRFAERVPGDHITLTRFHRYWNANAIHFDKIIYRVVPSSLDRAADLKAGKIDLAVYIAPGDAGAVRQDPNLRLVAYDSLGYFGIVNNIGSGKGADSPYGRSALVRQAFSLAIDRTALTNTIFLGMGAPTMQAVPAESEFYDAGLKVPSRDVAKSRELLAQAGVKTPVPLELMVADDPDLVQAAKMIQSMVSQVGFDVHIRVAPLTRLLALAEPGDYQALMIGWSGRSDIDGNVYPFLHSGEPQNLSGYANPIVDKLLDEARDMTSIVQRKALYSQMWTQEQKDLPITYLWTPRNIVGMSAKLQGFRAAPDGIIRLQKLQMGTVATAASRG